MKALSTGCSDNQGVQCKTLSMAVKPLLYQGAGVIMPPFQKGLHDEQTQAQER